MHFSGIPGSVPCSRHHCKIAARGLDSQLIANALLSEHAIATLCIGSAEPGKFSDRALTACRVGHSGDCGSLCGRPCAHRTSWRASGATLQVFQRGIFCKVRLRCSLALPLGVSLSALLLFMRPWCCHGCGCWTCSRDVVFMNLEYLVRQSVLSAGLGRRPSSTTVLQSTIMELRPHGCDISAQFLRRLTSLESITGLSRTGNLIMHGPTLHGSSLERHFWLYTNISVHMYMSERAMPITGPS